MSKVKITAIAIVSIIVLFALYRLAFIRVVNYDIAGIKIPSEYNILTGSVRPIDDYKGKADLPSLESVKSNRLGLSGEQVTLAKLRWAVFEEWAKRYPEYKDWRSNPEIFKNAHDAFEKEVRAHTRIIVIK